MAAMCCPQCGKDTTLWQGASKSGWVNLNPDGTTDGRWEASHFEHELEEEYGCGECGWESGAAPVAADVEPEPDPNQMSIPVPDEGVTS